MPDEPDPVLDAPVLEEFPVEVPAAEDDCCGWEVDPCAETADEELPAVDVAAPDVPAVEVPAVDVAAVEVAALDVPARDVPAPDVTAADEEVPMEDP